MTPKDHVSLDERKGLLLTQSGSQKRKRHLKRCANCTPAEAEQFDELLKRHGGSMSELIKDHTIRLNEPVYRSARHPTDQQKHDARQLAGLGVIMDFIEEVRLEIPDSPLVDAVVRECVDMRASILEQQGRKP